jgi:hypothetical protein
MKHKKTVLVISLLLGLIVVSGSLFVYRIKTQIKELFRMNKELQEQGYYMAEFEFKMLGLGYLLDRDHYYTAFSKINRLHHQLKTKEGLRKVPKFENKQDELEFYLNLQNPQTGAFMDDSYPFCSYTGPTGNVLNHLDALAEETGQPLKLKYPLKYLDEINTPEKLDAYLDDVSTVGWLANKFPQTSFHFARDLLSLFNEDNTIEKHGLYNVTPEWKMALLRWFYDNQDPATGLWGPKTKSRKLRRKDTMNSASIIKAFVDEEGNNKHEEFPLRYQNELAGTILERAFKPVPKDDDLSAWHEWNLDTPKSIRTLTRYLWKGISPANKEKSKEFMEYYIKIQFDKFYVPSEGAFSYYPHGEHATLDGSGGYFIFKEIGALSSEKQQRLWGKPEQTIIDLGTCKRSRLGADDFALTAKSKGVNSLRIYRALPAYDNLASNIWAIVYPDKPSVLDIIDLTSKMKHWINTTDQSMGNWVSKEEIKKQLDTVQFEEAPVFEKEPPLEQVNSILRENGKIAVVGFDILQVPRYKIIYEYSPE